MKICKKCKNLKSIRNDFYKHKSNFDGHSNICKPCVAFKNKNCKLQRDENRKAFNFKNPNYNKQYYNNNIEHCRKLANKHYSLHKDKKKQKNLEYRKNNIQRKIASNLRSRLYCAIVGNSKTGSAVSDLGCSIEQLKTRLESKFQPGMTWDNYGKWHIDHIVPLTKFNLADRDQLLKACHYSNLQPLWAKDNLHKGARVND